MVDINNLIRKNIIAYNKNQKNCISSLEKKHPGIEFKYEIKRELDKNIKNISSSKDLISKALLFSSYNQTYYINISL